MPSHPSTRRADSLYWFFTWLAVAGHLSRAFDPPASLALGLYQLVLLGSYALLFIAPLWLLGQLGSRLHRGLGLTLSVLLAGLLQLLIYADGLLWQLYGFHLNGFVWNILTTPGGIAALGSSESTQSGFALIAAALLLGQALLRLLASALARWQPRLPAPRWLWVLPLFLLATLGERVSYGVSHFYGYSPLLETAQRMPFYQPLTMRRFLEQQLGLQRPQRLELENVALKGQLKYPQAPLRLTRPDKPLNLVWLVAESWRADSLNPRVMPQTDAFAARALRFDSHFSGGNGTRIGMFSQFYGLPANLWFSVLDARIGSPLIDVLQQQDYQMRLFTSAKFSYPEFDKTLFVKVPPAQMQSYDRGPSWQRDRKNVDDLLQFIDQRDRAKPFMTFMFFESPHANYDFPPESVIEPDYLPDFSYASMDLERDIDGIYKRYLNAVHHLDGQIARVVDHLEQRGLLDDTLIVITGDHGEEFMDNGRWGHNSTFVDAQLRVPLVLWVPGREAQRTKLRTSHVDLLPTLLPLLGVNNPAHDYSIGQSLFSPSSPRLLVAGDWDRLAFLGERHKVVLPFTSGSFTALQASRADDRRLANAASVLQQALPQIRSELQGFRRFLAH
ncbi:sulfatase-like hydrolase/transferase [Ectopseudomonas hydrolytica]|uniref:Sulfatase-like hydrolase/transferase n=1 Tax=Ectopseudomonas hydrolytica TaxID=2493633 RepID=A0ABY5A0T8_9GAMM|nr:MULTISPECIES: sulfatase-like hydrolase/transferase [Pseudomonas]MDH0095475.1 sulfatase-like hydrolase/transferase [Pseudomonas sp. GD04158]USR37478.1 sulfatase-like hydrolase/transferase [Pseudomonas hydrolytica]